ncbi:helix-turn-helix domain-containing protein [Propionibacterium freudenreichii]|uniref:helix-turn-helix domain-containing protein n=1 Tax=Propionibacterium freudenreichii TaxID=1744 RepID=UPI00254B3EA5|nr:helix-turn-helix domain-containing protein [Propionibacterium freudenreichii]MDK9661430.1 helix-turn-helix domain-containing protein [Propionibacterium freudenreichii]
MSQTHLISPTYLSLQQATAEGYGAYSTLRKYIADGRLPAVKIGSRIKIRESDLQDLATPVRGDAEAPINVAIQRLVDAAPGLTRDQITRLSAVLGDVR